MAMREHTCQCGRKWLIETHVSTGTEVASLDCRCGQQLVQWCAEEQYTARQIWNNPVALRDTLQTTTPNETFPPGTEIHVSTYATSGLRFIYVGQRTYFVEEDVLARAIEGIG